MVELVWKRTHPEWIEVTLYGWTGRVTLASGTVEVIVTLGQPYYYMIEPGHTSPDDPIVAKYPHLARKRSVFECCEVFASWLRARGIDCKNDGYSITNAKDPFTP